MQGFEQRLDLVLEHARHQPFATLLVDLVQHKQRHRHREAVLGVTGLVQIGGGAIDTAQPHGFGERLGGDARRLVAHELLTREQQELAVASGRRTAHRHGHQVLGLFAGIAVPGIKTVAAADVGGQLLVIKGVDQFVVDQHVLAARLVLQVFHLLDELLVGLQKRPVAVPLGIHQRLADENFTRADQVDPAVIHAPAAVHHDAVQRGALQRVDLGRLLFPMRVEQLFLEQMAAHLLQPLRLNGRNAAAKQARGLDQFGRHDPAARLFDQMGAGVRVKLDAARAQVLTAAASAFSFQLVANVAEQAGQHRQMQLLVTGRQRVEAPLVLGHHGVQLRVNVAPLAHPAHADEILPQQLLVLTVGEFVLPHPALAVVDPFPQLEVAAELALFVVKLGMRLVGLLLRLHGPVAHVLHRQRRGNHQHLVKRLTRARFQNHAAHTRVERQFGQLLAGGGEFVGIVHGAEFVEQQIAVGNGAPRRFLDERKVLHHAQVQRLHAQNHAGQRAAQDFGFGEFGPASEVFFVIKPDADAVGHPAAAPGALVRRALADRLDQQLLDLASEAVALHARRARIDHVADARHRERGLGHVGGQHNAAPVVAVKNTVLLGLAQARKQRQHLGAAKHRLVAQVAAQVVGGFADLAFTRQKDQNVAAVVGITPKLVDRIGDGVVEVVVARFLERPVTLLDREHAPGHHDDGRRSFATGKVLGKTLGINRGRSHHHFQIRPARQDLLEVAQQEVNVQAAFVGLVDDDRVVGFQQRVGLCLGQQNAVGHQFDRAVAAQAVLKSHLETNHIAQRGV